MTKIVSLIIEWGLIALLVWIVSLAFGFEWKSSIVWTIFIIDVIISTIVHIVRGYYD